MTGKGVTTQPVGAEDDGARLDRWFKRHYPQITHIQLEKLLRKGEVRLDGKRAKASDRILRGQIVRLPPQVSLSEGAAHRPAVTGPSDAAFVQNLVIYKDDAVIVLNKPSGLATQGGSGLTKHLDGMLDALAFGKSQRPRLVHRLDRDTSGVILVARTVPAAAKLADALRRRDASKIYWALTKGVPRPPQGTISLALAKEGGHGPHGRDERMTPAGKDDDGAKHAITDYALMGQAGKDYAWLAAKPVTGRTHQIRVHLAAIGHAIIGDHKYGGEAVTGQGEIADRLHLHARSLDIAHPDGGRLRVTASLSEHMLATWSLLGFDPEDERQPFAQRSAS